MPSTYCLIQWQLFGLLLLCISSVMAGLVPARAGAVGDHSIPSDSEPSHPESGDPWKGTSGEAGTWSEPGGYITSSDLAPGGDAEKPLFSNSDFKDLAEKVSSFLDAYSSTSTPTTTSFEPVVTHTPVISEAALGCSIYSSYMSLCAPATTSSSPKTPKAPQATESAIASCACYSATYYVPEALDSAASACAGYPAAYASGMPNTDLVPLVTSASSMEGFCARAGNVRNYATAQFGQATPTPTAVLKPSGSSAPPLHQYNGGNRLDKGGVGLWGAAFASFLLF